MLNVLIHLGFEFGEQQCRFVDLIVHAARFPKLEIQERDHVGRAVHWQYLQRHD